MPDWHHNKPSGFNDTTESTRVKYSLDTNNLAGVFLLTRSHRRPIVPPGQPDHRSMKGPVSHHVARPQSTNNPRTASEPRPEDKRHTIHGSQCYSVCRFYYRPRPHCSSAKLPRFALHLDSVAVPPQLQVASYAIVINIMI